MSAPRVSLWPQRQQRRGVEERRCERGHRAAAGTAFLLLLSFSAAPAARSPPPPPQKMPSAGYPRGPARSPAVQCSSAKAASARLAGAALLQGLLQRGAAADDPGVVPRQADDDRRQAAQPGDLGHRRPGALPRRPIYYRDADAALLVYDITDADSFKKVKSWVKELRNGAPPPPRPPAAPARPPAGPPPPPPNPLTAPLLSPQVGEDIVISIAATSSTSSGSASSRNRRRPTTPRPSARSTPRPRRRMAEGLRTPSAEWRGGCSRRPRWRRG